MTSIPLARAVMCFSMFVYIPARFRFALIGGNLTAQSTGIPDTSLQALLPFRTHPAARAPQGARSQARQTSLYWSNFSAGRNFVWYCRVNVTLVELLQLYFECQ